ncbi:CASP-like protein 1E1 [Beta vulgaris subsp. vulgaris]|uniref:CASP-like protein 1E1 n=1 Tax=Beta vulgaris subsp. vulgaris TaxID=3555 RepID=UPI0020372E46|nr:CASP-like protein 1E1 [Beta vulgaris subsp. vulgaris]
MERANNGGLDGIMHKSKEKEGYAIGWLELVLRCLAFLLTLIAAILLGIDKQTKIVPIKISTDLPAFNVPVTAKSSYVSAFVYFVVANSIACAFAALSLALAFMRKGGGKGIIRLMIIVVDLMMIALLFSGIGATGAVGLIGFKGNSHLMWNKVCNVYGKFCHQVMGSLALSLFGAIAFVLLVSLSVSKLYNRA